MFWTPLPPLFCLPVTGSFLTLRPQRIQSFIFVLQTPPHFSAASGASSVSSPSFTLVAPLCLRPALRPASHPRRSTRPLSAATCPRAPSPSGRLPAARERTCSLQVLASPAAPTPRVLVIYCLPSASQRHRQLVIAPVEPPLYLGSRYCSKL